MGLYDVEIYYPDDWDRTIDDMQDIAQQAKELERFIGSPRDANFFRSELIERPIAFFRIDGELVGYEQNPSGDWIQKDIEKPEDYRPI